jgi:hypothetical protein
VSLDVPTGGDGGDEPDFATGLRARASVVDRMARTLANKTVGLWAGRDHDDVASLLNEALWAIWREAGRRWPPDWERQLHWRGRSVVRQWADRSAGLGGVTGVTEKRRQLRSLMHAEAEWAASHGGRLPTPRELADWWQGLGGTVTERDLRSVGSTLSLTGGSEALGRPGAGAGPLEAAGLDVGPAIAALVGRAGRTNPAFARFAQAWLSAVAAGEEPSITEVASRTGTPRASATRYVAALRAAARSMAAELLQD